MSNLMDWFEEGYSAQENLFCHGIVVTSLFIMFPCLCILILHFLKNQYFVSVTQKFSTGSDSMSYQRLSAMFSHFGVEFFIYKFI